MLKRELIIDEIHDLFLLANIAFNNDIPLTTTPIINERKPCHPHQPLLVISLLRIKLMYSSKCLTHDLGNEIVYFFTLRYPPCNVAVNAIKYRRIYLEECLSLFGCTLHMHEDIRINRQICCTASIHRKQTDRPKEWDGLRNKLLLHLFEVVAVDCHTERIPLPHDVLGKTERLTEDRVQSLTPRLVPE